MSTIFTSPEEAEEAFYDAIRRRDLDALMSVWADDDEIVCIHPTGQRLSGTTAIRESWRSIFANNPRFTVSIQREVRWESVLLCVHSVVESLFLGNDLTTYGPMQSTNVFYRSAHGWRMLSRHTSAASIPDAPTTETELEGKQPHTLH